MKLTEKLRTLRIGPFPIGILGVVIVILFLAAQNDLLSNDVIGGLASLMATGYVLTTFGAHAPVVKRFGGPALICVLVPSLFVGYHLIPADAMDTITSAMNTDNVLYLYIASLVVGSVLGIERSLLVSSFPRRFMPLIVGSIVATITGPLVGMLFGINPWHSFLFIVTPILSGGLGEGILPLALAYSEITGKSRVELSSIMIPAALIANVFAIITASTLSRLGETYPQLNTINTEHLGSITEPVNAEDNTPLNIELMAAGLLIICTLYTFGRLLSPLVSIPPTIVMIILVVFLKIAKLIPAPLEAGTFQVYKSISKALTPAILVGLSVLYIPWDMLIEIIRPGYLAVCIATVVSMVASGFWIGRLLKLPPVDSAIICACHSGFGGMGDMAILATSKRQYIMPFAEIATSLGGAVMVILATLLLRANWQHLQGIL